MEGLRSKDKRICLEVIILLNSDFEVLSLRNPKNEMKQIQKQKGDGGST